MTWDMQKFLMQPWTDVTPVTTNLTPQKFSDPSVMATIFEPIGTGLIVALISRYIINNKKICDSVCAAKQEEPQIVEDDSSSSTTSVEGAEVHRHHITSWMRT